MKRAKTFLALSFIFCGYMVKAQDWPNLKYYQAANQKVRDEHAVKVVYMGDSITESWMTALPDFFLTNGYTDRGISGQTSPQMVLRFRQDVIDLKPKVVVLLCGINDLAGNTGPSSIEMIEDNIKTMAELAKINNIKMVLCSVLPSRSVFWRPDLNPMDDIITLNKWIRNYAGEKHLFYLDYYTALVDDQKGLKAVYAKDGVHPNVPGYKVMEPLAKAAVNSALK
ncbi:MAG: SGNH/GDSL hydrolase family protein [Bacteroidota bacterium]|nr:SGNH/GDSL hydrolase family protein [Bacteroidota bacterium]